MRKQLQHYYRALAVDLAYPETRRELVEQVAAVIVSMALLGTLVSMFAQVLTGHALLFGPYLLPGLGIGLISGVIFTAITYHYGKRQACSDTMAANQEAS